MKNLFLATVFVVAASGSAFAGSIRVENGDSKTHNVELNCSGSSKSVEIRASTAATYTFHSSHKECDITGGSIKFPMNNLEDGQKWKIKDGNAKAN